MNRPRWILPVIIVAEFTASSPWFAGNAILPDLQAAHNAGGSALAWMTSSVQIGFILGTLVSALLGIADRYSPRILFLIFSLLAATFNLAILAAPDWISVLGLRFLTGVCLAGIYPVGMKIAAGWYKEGLGRAIGFLVGALVVGTALPHLVRAVGDAGSWQAIIIVISIICAFGGVLMAIFVPDGPHHRKAARLQFNAIAKIFSVPGFRASSFGYFGHMWELYTLWAFVPLILTTYAMYHGTVGLNISLWSFFVIAMGGVGCAAGGLLSQWFGSSRIAAVQLAASGISCLLLPFFIQLPLGFFLGFLLFWGTVVAGDSPQFSTLNAQTAPPESVGSGLTIANSIGFALTVPSLLLAGELAKHIPVEWIFPTIVIGPILGLLALRPLVVAGK